MIQSTDDIVYLQRHLSKGQIKIIVLGSINREILYVQNEPIYPGSILQQDSS